MNKVFRVIWSEAQGAWVAVSETTKSHSKRSRKSALALALTAGSLMTISGTAVATGKFVESGEASIAIDSGKCSLNTAADGKNSVSIGCGAGAGAAGKYQGSKADFDTSIGYQAGTSVKGSENTAIGSNAGESVEGDENTAFGVSAGKLVKGSKNVSLGFNSGFQLNGDGNISAGDASGGSTYGDNNVMLGTAAKVNGSAAANRISDTVLIGTRASASSSDNVAIGKDTQATHANSVALGHLSQTRAAESVIDGVISYGTSTGTKTYKYSGFAGTASGVVSVGSGVAGVGAERQIINVAPGAITKTSTDAVNGSQLYLVAEGLNKRIDAIVPSSGGGGGGGGDGWNISDGSKSSEVKTGNTVTIAGNNTGTTAGNINVTNDGNGNLTIESNVNVKHDSVTVGGTTINKDTGITVGGTNINNQGDITVGDKVSVKNDGVTVGDVSITVDGGIHAGDKKITNVAKGEISETSTDAINGSQLNEANNRVTKNEGDIKNIQNGKDGMFQVSQDYNAPAPKPTGTKSAAGGAGAVASGDNSTAIGNDAKATASNSTALGNSAWASANNSVALGQGSVADRANSVSVGTVGGERQITNVAAGVAPTDAVNVSQLDALGSKVNQYFNAANKRIDKVDNNARAGIAAAMAAGTLPQSTLPGKSMVTVGASTYRGESAIAIGVSRLSDNARTVIKANASADSRGNAGAAVGAGWHW